jgi:hypothetical protein
VKDTRWMVRFITVSVGLYVLITSMGHLIGGCS